MTTQHEDVHEKQTDRPGSTAPVPPLGPGRWDRTKFWLPIGLSLVLASAVVLADLGRETTGLLAVMLMLTLMAASVPIGLAMVIASTLGLLALGGMRVTSVALEQLPFETAASWSLSVIPLFILMGVALSKSGLTRLAYQSATAWLGRLPGGLAIATNFSGAGLAAASGSSIGISYALGRVAIPEMIRAGYRPSLATGTVAAVGTLGQLIPPSILLVVYAGVVQTPVGPQLLSAVVPGVIMACAFGLMIFLRAALTPGLAPRVERGASWSEKLRSTVGVLPVAIVVLVVIAGMYLGIFTPTEAGAVGALVALAVGWLAPKANRSMRGLGKLLRESLFEVATATASIFLLLIGVGLLTQMFTRSGVATAFADWIIDLDLPVFVFLLALIVVFIILGMFLDPMAMVLLTVPILTMPLDHYGIDLMWFGVFIVVMGEIALITPPVGVLTYVVARIAREPVVNLGQTISLMDVFRGVTWFAVVAVLVVLLLIAFPDLATWLPNQSSASS